MQDAKCEHGEYKQFCDFCKEFPKTKEQLGDERKKRALERLHSSSVEVWRSYRSNCHMRLRGLIQQVHDEGKYKPAQYYRSYDHVMGTEPRDYLGNRTFNEAFYKGFGQFMDVTVGRELLFGFAGESRWLRFLEKTGKMSVEEFNKELQSKQIRIHGGNGAWSAQQLYFEFWKQPDCWPIVHAIVFGRDDRSPDKLSDDEMVKRLDFATKEALFPNEFRPSMFFCSKLIHIYDSTRWPVVNARANTKVASRVNLVIPSVTDGRSYLKAASEFRRFAATNGLTDLGEADLIMSDEYGNMRAAAGWSPTDSG